MTAEIAVMNKSAVALAADSAVTIETENQGLPRQGKVFNTANKLFTLSKYQPIGIMIYNTMEVGGVPWETVIKMFREHLHNKKFATVQDYCDYFITHLANNRTLFPDDRQAEIIFRIIRRYFYRAAHNVKNKQHARKTIDAVIAELEKHNLVDGFPGDIEKTVESRFKDAIDAAATGAFKRSHISGLKRRYRRLAVLLLSRDFRLDGYSGVVVAGFGEEEVFPSLHRHWIDGIVAGHVKIHRSPPSYVNNSRPSFVLPFADEETVTTILQGVNPTYSYSFLREARRLFMGLPANLIAQVPGLTVAQRTQLSGAGAAAADRVFREFVRRMDGHRRTTYTRPIEQAISVMPTTELATVAETFINLAQIRQRMSLDTETVGGPVDVAVISKGDGFVWIKRKHYFDQELNPYFLAKYFRTGTTSQRA